MFCTKCGNKLSDEMNSCPKCGAPIYSAGADAQPYQKTRETIIEEAKPEIVRNEEVKPEIIENVEPIKVEENKVEEHKTEQTPVYVAAPVKIPTPVEVPESETTVTKTTQTPAPQQENIQRLSDTDAEIVKETPKDNTQNNSNTYNTSNNEDNRPGGSHPSFGIWLAISIVDTVCCCNFLFGVIAIVMVCLGNSSYQQGNYKDADSKMLVGKIFAIVALILGILQIAIAAVMIASGYSYSSIYTNM